MAGNGSAERCSVVSKVAAILRTFRFGGALTVTEIAQMTELPLSTAHRLVVELADWQLLSRGDPRGELITLQLLGKQKKRVASLIAEHGQQWLGALAPIVDARSAVFEHGFAADVLLKYSARRQLSPVMGHRDWSTVRTPVLVCAGVLVNAALAALMSNPRLLYATSSARLDHVLRTVRLRRSRW